MLPERWEKIDDIFHEALQVSADLRGDFLESACDGDTGLRRDIESLLQSHEQSSKFLARPAMEHHGRTFGPYRVVRKISRGGMGVVYLAERIDQHFDKQVAIKVIPELFLPDGTRHLIESEVAILAGLEHPNIARLLDAGVTIDGFRWIAMEFIDGVPLDRFATEHRLDERERLTLFQKICGAIQYSHRSLIAHRDLQPSNILVTKEGDPRLVDFGVARVAAPAGSTAKFANPIAFSPSYASPGQIAGKRVTAADDIFSLGAILYELLSEKPFRSRTGTWGLTELTPTLEPALDSLRGDLRLIVQKAVRVDPDQRYESAASLSDDLRRYLSGELVLARPHSAPYRLGRFAGRHRLAVATGVSIVVLSCVAAIAIVNESRLAQRRFALMRDFSRGVLFDLSGKLPDLAGNRRFRGELLQTGVRYLDTLSREAGSDSTLFLELATGYSQAGDALSVTATGLQADPAGAAENYSKAIASSQRIGKSSPEWDEAQNILISASAGLGALQKDQKSLQNAVDVARTRHDQDKSSLPRARVLAKAEFFSATDSLLGYRAALAVAERTYRANPTNVEAGRLYLEWSARTTVAYLFASPHTAWMILEPTFTLGRNLVAQNPKDKATAYLFANALSAAGWSRCHREIAGLPRAREYLLESIALLNRFPPEDPTDLDYRSCSAMARMSVSYLEMTSGNNQAAIRAALEGLEIMKPVTGTSHESPIYNQSMGGLHVHAARAYHMARDMSQACSHYREANRFYGLTKVPPDPYFGELLGFVALGKKACGIH